MRSRILRHGVAIAGLGLILGGMTPTSASGPGDSQGALRGLVLWNHLGNADQIADSVVGAGFSVTPGVVRVDGYRGKATATTGGETGGGGYLWMPPDEFFAADPSSGTVEMWLQKHIQRFDPYTTPLIGIFGPQPYDFQGGESSYEPIHAFWSDGLTGKGGLEFGIWATDGNLYAVNDLGWDAVPVGKWVHVAFVWDLEGIGGTQDTLRIYRNGALVASSAASIPGIQDSDARVKLLGHHAYHRFGQPTLSMDEIRVWDHARTWFPQP